MRSPSSWSGVRTCSDTLDFPSWPFVWWTRTSPTTCRRSHPCKPEASGARRVAISLAIHRRQAVSTCCARLHVRDTRTVSNLCQPKPPSAVLAHLLVGRAGCRLARARGAQRLLEEPRHELRLTHAARWLPRAIRHHGASGEYPP